jgi:hypothetical protein
MVKSVEFTTLYNKIPKLPETLLKPDKYLDKVISKHFMVLTV